jgi:hypothetical protein
VIPSVPADVLAGLFERFEREKFGARAGGAITAGDAALEGEIARKGVDAYAVRVWYLSILRGVRF